ncbi:M3 family metallopeptidase [Paenarthrobacter sp. DKR-5]|uniref:M3 family metallopeptidase n=1 Tax=Paenarthrobacter sp. DKR-5 TaxID=2835535 RepID=UPI001BDBC809|nr:M3 family metallopeptidase [Paenarthrobacter sp. DKR-5]MBT1003698.1 M3 family metallopeptidase [Paenarthrobacter sp. DKR-5]
MTNPFLSPSTLDYELPPFEQIRDEHYLPAFEAGIREHAAEIDAIASNPEPATFANTAEALERAGATLRRVSIVFFNKSSADSTDSVQEIETVIAPRLAAHEDDLYLNKGLFARLSAVDADAEDLDDESRRLLEEYLRRFRRAGAQLDDSGQQRLRTINEELSELSTRFSQSVLRDTNDLALLVDDADELAGLSPDDLAAARQAAADAGHEGKYLLTLLSPSGQPALASLANRATRKRLMENSLVRGSRENANKSVGIGARMAVLRAERSELLGYGNYAECATADQTAPSYAAVKEMLATITPAAVRNARAEAEALAEAAGHDLEPWDWAYYSEQVRQQKFSLDRGALRPYFELDRVLQDGVFFAANRLYGLSFEERSDLSGYHPDVRVWEVRDADGAGLGLFLGDYFTRPTKVGGAWMNPLVEQSRLLGQKPVVVNNLNIPKPPAGEPALLTLDEVRTTFHEFGHALHGLLSDVTYPLFSGPNVPRDFVEYPSQVNEMWMFWPEVLANYARHHRTGEALPRETVDKLEEAKLWGQGFGTTEYLGATLLDLAWHELAPGAEPGDPLEFEATALEAAGVAYPLVPPRYRTGYFKHIFASGYAAGYYSYIWSEALDADTVEWFKENGGLQRDNGDHFRRELLSRGNSRDPLESFRAFRGRDADIAPLLERRGLN